MSRLDLVQGDYSDHKTWETLRRKLDKHKSTVAVFYMAIPPDMFPTVAKALASVGLNERGRIVVEKPFGRDLASAIELNEILHSVFPEERIFRIDHYLGKESVEDLLVFRFSNTLLEPVWNRNYVRSVQITMSETIGVEGRGSFYDSVGAIRDVMQNHLLQVLSLAAMEPPVGPEASFLQDEKAKVFAAKKPVDPTQLVRGQYVGSSFANRRACCSMKPTGRHLPETSYASDSVRRTASPSRSRPRRPGPTSTARTSMSR
jgi:glucose-6-phosphate 1-dehydrogenase